MNHPLFSMEIRFENDIVSVRQRARQISALLDFDELEQARVATAVSEIARNALNHAQGGRVEFLVDDRQETGKRAVFIITVSDNGPGIADLPAVLEGRCQRQTGPGLGLLSARRLMDEFEIDSGPGRGTTVRLGKRFAKLRTTFTSGDLPRLRRAISRAGPQDPFEEIRQQNQELLRAMEELRNRQEELVRLNRELEDTNRGVVALYAELDEKAAHLRRADELKSRFLSNMSHEFRTPLNSVLALSRLLLERVDGDLTADQAKQVAYIQKNAQDLSELVNDLLDLAKVEAGRIPVTPARMEVANLFAGLRGIFRPLLVNPSVNLVFEEPQDIPPMNTDEGKVSQILRNFISNALKFTERGEVVVAARFEPDRKAVTFAVRDTGIGIAPEDQQRIFEEFTQLDNPIQRKVKGTGLGLPLSKKLAALLGGSIRVESEPGAGSVFYATVPLVCPGAQIGAAEGAPVHDTTRFPLLVLEDDENTLMLYQKYLKGAGYQILPATTVAEGRKLLKQLCPAAIILDVLLPGGGAWDFLVEVKRDEATREIPVYVVGILEETQKGFALGADDYCVKPMDRKWLLEKLRKMARRAPLETVLIIDDDEVSRYVLRDLLADTRYQVLEAAGGAEGLRLARERRPQVVFLDLIMPEMSGFEVLERLKADAATRDIPVIIVTSKALGEEERLLLSKHVVTILSKEAPSRQQAIASIRDALIGARAQRLPSEDTPHAN